MTDRLAMSSFVAFLNRETDAGRRDFTPLRDSPVASWPELLGTAGTAPSYGTLRAMLSYARTQFDRDPGLALAITTYVTAHVEEVEPFQESVVLTDYIRGLAWKEHANALYAISRYDDAASAAEKAISVLAFSSALESDLAAANLVRAMSFHSVGRTVEALQLAIMSVRIFASNADSAQYLAAIQICGGILFDLDEYPAALDAYRVALSIAEEEGNQREYARMLNNLGTCNLCLDNREIAERQLQQAFRLFDAQHMESEMLRTVATLGRVTKRHGSLEQALDVIANIYADLLHHGLALSAAQVLVELTAVVMQMTGSTDHARDVWIRLAATFKEEDAPQNLLAAIAFLEHKMARSEPLSQLRASIDYVQSFLRDVMYVPTKVFVVSG